MSTNEDKYASGENVDLTAYALGELGEAEMENLAKKLEGSPEMRAELEETRAMAAALGEALDSEPKLELSEVQRAAILGDRSGRDSAVPRKAPKSPMRRVALVAAYAASIALVFTVGAHLMSEVEDNELRYKFSYVKEGGASSGDPVAAIGYLGDETRKQLPLLGYEGDAGASPGVDDQASANWSAWHSFDGADGFGRPLSDKERESFWGNPDSTSANTESYAYIRENKFRSVANEPLSTFSIDVDTASYANVRRFLTNGQLPPADAVRIEELVNYFNYDYPTPTGSDPFSVNVEVTSAPWRPQHRLVRIGLRGKDIAFEGRRPTNLVFLLDVSGSMNSADKLPLVKKSLRLLVDQLESSDHVAIAVYAGAAGVILPPTSGNAKGVILEAMERLSAGGSTNGGEGIQLAYEMARRNLEPEGVNRVILCTDGDFNVGTSSEGELVRMVQEQARDGIELSVLGFGTGNLKDSTMEQMADHGNGNYSYIDTVREARKVLVEEMGGTLVTIAKDVKIQVEFNPLEVAAYRLIGYENRLLANEDFNDDRVDAGEIGSGHTVTALYEIVPPGMQSDERDVDPLKYKRTEDPSVAAGQGEMMTVKLRYKEPKGSKSRLIERVVRDSGISLEEASADTRFAASVAEFGMLLRGSENVSSSKLEQVLRRAVGGLGPDPGGYRTEFVGLITRAIALGVTGDANLRALGYGEDLESIGYLGEDE